MSLLDNGDHAEGRCLHEAPGRLRPCSNVKLGHFKVDFPPHYINTKERPLWRAVVASWSCQGVETQKPLLWTHFAWYTITAFLFGWCPSHKSCCRLRDFKARRQQPSARCEQGPLTLLEAGAASSATASLINTGWEAKMQHRHWGLRALSPA